MRRALSYLMVFVGGVLLGAFAFSPFRHEPAALLRTDTVRISTPELMVVHTRDTIVARFPCVRRDTVCLTDTVEVLVPIEQREYADSNYRAWVSGYRPRLDSLVLINRNLELQQNKFLNRFSVGIHAGIGLTPKGVQPYVGVGVSMRIL